MSTTCNVQVCEVQGCEVRVYLYSWIRVDDKYEYVRDVGGLEELGEMS